MEKHRNIQLFSIEFFGDLELPNNIFEKKIYCREDEIFF